MHADSLRLKDACGRFGSDTCRAALGDKRGVEVEFHKLSIHLSLFFPTVRFLLVEMRFRPVGLGQPLSLWPMTIQYHLPLAPHRPRQT